MEYCALPAEIRHIVFCSAEVASAVREYRRYIGRPLPVGALRRVDLRGIAAGARVLLDIVPDDGAAPGCWEIGNSELSEALVFYCRAHEIPLPMAGTKGLQCFGDSLLLIVTLNLRGAGWPLSAGLSLQRASAAAA